MIPAFTEVMDRFRTGERVEERDFDMSLFRETERVKKKYDIRYDPNRLITMDDALADRCYEAGRDMFASVGTYCIDTGRVARFSLDEIDAAVAGAPSSVEWGKGEDAFTLRYRPVEGDVPAFVWGGVQTLLYTDEETALAVCRDCCSCRDVHGVWGGIVPHLDDGKELYGGSPEEIFPYRRSAEILRQAALEAGRPGMPVLNSAPLSMTHFGMYASDGALRPTDGIEVGGIPELKTSFDQLHRASFALATGVVHSGGLGVVIGGFSGSVEGAAVAAVASAFYGLLVVRGRVVVLTATPIRNFTRAGKTGIWVGTLALQSLNRNARLVIGGFMCDHPQAGPGTDQYFYETAAGTVPSVVCGTNSWGGTRKFKIGQTLDYGSPVESHFLGRVTRAATGLDREHAARIALTLFERYKNSISEAPEGYTLRHLYDIEARRPLPEYLKTYNRVARELRNLGLPLADYEE